MVNDEIDPSAQKADDNVLLEVYKTHWSDLHHIRDMDWQLARFILFGFLAIGAFDALSISKVFLATTSFCFAFVSTFGIQVARRSKFKLRKKIKYVQDIEEEIGLNRRLPYNPSDYMIRFSTANFLIVLFALSAGIFIYLTCYLVWSTLTT